MSGTVVGRNNTTPSQVISAYWQPGQYSPGAGALVIVADIDTFSNQTATYSPLNADGIFALNTTALAAGVVPEPTTVSLMGFGLAAIGVGRRLSRSRALAATSVA